jgi:hypothetical protein
MVIVGAQVAVVAIGSGEWLEIAAASSQADVGCALLIIRTIALFIKQFVAVIVSSVTDFQRGNLCIALV